MIWIALLFAHIFGASSFSSLVPNLDKHVKKHVVEKSSKKQVLAIVKEDFDVSTVTSPIKA